MGSRYGLLVKVQLAILLGRDLGFDFAHRQGPPIWVVVKIRVLLGTLNSRRRIIVGTQKGTIILTTTHIRSASGSLSC